MVRSGRGGPKKIAPKAPVIVQNTSSVNSLLARSAEVGNNDLPVRTVLYIEVGDLSPAEARGVVNHVMGNLPNGHPHYCTITRHGKVTSGVEFEGDFLNTVKAMCEIKDGEIVLKGGAQEIDLIKVSV